MSDLPLAIEFCTINPAPSKSGTLQFRLTAARVCGISRQRHSTPEDWSPFIWPELVKWWRTAHKS
eukprot:7050131-Lingulodinium_polyedra.AAC.1